MPFENSGNGHVQNWGGNICSNLSVPPASIEESGRLNGENGNKDFGIVK